MELEFSYCFCDSWLYFQIESGAFVPSVNRIFTESDFFVFVKPINWIQLFGLDNLERVLFFVVVEYTTVKSVFELSWQHIPNIVENVLFYGRRFSELGP